MTREKAIKWLKVEASYIEEDVGHGKEILEAYDMAIEALEQTRWIPCSERLPENEGVYLVTFKLSFMNFIEVCTFTKAGWNKVGYDEVIAWMPLPEVYRGGESE